MTVKVDLTRLAEALTDHDFAYLLTVSEDLRPHAVAVTPVLDEGRLGVGGLGGRTLANLGVRPDVTLLFPPREPDGYSLIVDGRAEALDGEAYVVPAHAVLHRPAVHAGEPADGSCGNDCVPVTSTGAESPG